MHSRKRLFLALSIMTASIGIAALEVDLSLGFNARNTDAIGFFPQVEIAANVIGCNLYNIIETQNGIHIFCQLVQGIGAFLTYPYLLFLTANS